MSGYYEKWEDPNVVHPLQERPDPAGWLHGILQRTNPCRKIVWERILKTSQSALDVGCGSCVDYTEFFKDTKVKWAGLEITPKFVKACKEVYHANVKLGDARNIPHLDESFDTVYCKDLFEHLEPDDWKIVAKEMVRVARKEVIIDFFHPPSTKPTRYRIGWKQFWSNWYNERELLSYLNEIGLELIKVHKNICSPLGGATHSIYILKKAEK